MHMHMHIQTIWNGTDQEARELAEIIIRNCVCGSEARNGKYCAPHTMLLSDQRALDGLLFARRIVVRLLREECDPVTAVGSEGS